MLLAACGGDSPVQPIDSQNSMGSRALPLPVEDLSVTRVADSSVTLRWTEVDDGHGEPAHYQVKYGLPPLDWESADLACEIEGDAIGAVASCEVDGLDSGTTYQFMLMSYRPRGNSQGRAVYSGVATATTTDAAADENTDPKDEQDDQAPANPFAVEDLEVVQATATGFTVTWTQVDDGTGNPARYRVKYDLPAIDYGSAVVGCNVFGDEIGAPASCTFSGLDPAATYDVQLMSYRVNEGSSAWHDAVYSNVVTAETAPAVGGGSDAGDVADPQPASPLSGVWTSAAELASLPTSGSAWNNVLSEANSSCGSVDLSNQEQRTNVCIMAKALVFARTGQTRYRDDVVRAVTQIVRASTYSGRALALGRELGAYVIAADLIDLRSHDRTLDASFRTKLRQLRTTYTSGAASSLVDCHERRPNNWGSHCGATRAAIAVYLGDDAELARTARVFRGYLGDRSAYSGFRYGGSAGSEDLSWQCNSNRPVGINPAGCSRNGLSLDGALPDDQRRGGSFTTNPPKENYVWEALQGLLAQAVILHRAGYDVWEWEDRALLRAVRWLHEVVDYPAEGDDTWQPHIVNHYYGTNFPAPRATQPGKNVGWTGWTHRR